VKFWGCGGAKSSKRFQTWHLALPKKWDDQAFENLSFFKCSVASCGALRLENNQGLVCQWFLTVWKGGVFYVFHNFWL